MVRKGQVEQRDEAGDLRFWWLNRMLETPRLSGRENGPLLLPFPAVWPGAQPYWMFRQNETFRRNALGNGNLLKQISREPAIMIFLPSRAKPEGASNNWAREVLELFSSGIGHYSEDIANRRARSPATGSTFKISNSSTPGGFLTLTETISGAFRRFLGRRHHSTSLSATNLPELIGARARRFSSRTRRPRWSARWPGMA